MKVKDVINEPRFHYENNRKIANILKLGLNHCEQHGLDPTGFSLTSNRYKIRL